MNFRAIILPCTLAITSACDAPCDIEREETCFDAAPTDELCLAYFERWFYNEADDACEMIAYSGCSQWGFASEEECKGCKCK